MSHAAHIPTLSTPAPRARRPVLPKLALVMPLVVIIAVALVLAATGPGAGTQGNVASDGPRGAEAGQVTHPRAVPPVMRAAPTRGSVAIASQR